MAVVTVICWSVLLAATLRYLIWYVATFRKALQIEGSTPLPSVRIYTPRYSPLIYLSSPYFAPLFKYLPFGWGNWMRYAVRDCTWNHKGTLPRQELGSDVYWLLGPGGPQLWVADADLIRDITHRWKDFPKPVMYYAHLLLFGESVLTAEGSTWQFHRKITARSFSHQNSSLVFTESQEQAKAMLLSWARECKEKKGPTLPKVTVDDLESPMATLALHVISGAGFGHKMQWQSHDSDRLTTQTDLSMDTSAPATAFPDTLKTFVNDIFTLFAVPSWFLRISPSAHLRNIQKAPDMFSKHVQQAINQARVADTQQVHDNKQHGKNDLLSNMTSSSSQGSENGLSDQEITGNVFIFTLAGHETTATTMQTALVLLALHPEFQQEIQDELDIISGSEREGEGFVYESDYPKMRHIMALMLETIRLFPPISGIPKWTNDRPQVAYHKGQAFDIPPDTSIVLDVIAVHRNPVYWGDDPHNFRPSRWLMNEQYEPPANSVSPSKQHAHMLCPQKGAFIPFSEGYRDCIGKSFAQAEFCAVIATLLKDYSIELVPPEGSTTASPAAWSTMCQTAWKALEDRRNLISLKMYGKVAVRFAPRGTEWRPRVPAV